MQYEPIKKSVGRFFSGPLFMRKLLYLLMDLLLLRAWYVKKALKKIGNEFERQIYVLDAGSGLGQYSWRMCRMYRSWKIEGIDINTGQVEGCNRFFKRAGLAERVSFSSGDLSEFSNPGKYSFILSVDVMEHIREDEKVFSNFHTSLKTNGMLLISTPSDKGGSDVHEYNDKSFIDEHVRNGYSIGEITSKLANSGFTEIKAYYTYGKPGNLSWRLAMKYPVKMLNLSYFFFLLLPFYYLIIFPVSIILNIFDVRLTHKSGTGLLVTARKY
jgi:SAM-dependent methyltransferase